MHIDFGSFFIQIAAFILLLLLLKKYAFGPLFEVMEKRRQHVLSEISTAEENRQEAASLLKEQEESLQKSRNEAYQIIEQAKQTSVRQAEEIVDNAKAEVARLKEDALKDIENERSKAAETLRAQVGAMSIMIAAKIIEQNLNEKEQKKLVDKYLKEVGGKL
ncbi:F0F1 ATP synthase subunit B [Chengkuizengella axinellae]|uniref:ATP synthase subunit b n=1 Tax=Chengkuizengella axinellae TaxID=3064388 RepID=A0ABT9J785_9BACL|nr:F0F1 ATP synthase subunit B [Chengkuizengella sp. 2205SS18-9]MDP5276824.1 F0F1 ATP synthase subunit B [Chengkuizengella sp. 2205SS18-9]